MRRSIRRVLLGLAIWCGAGLAQANCVLITNYAQFGFSCVNVFQGRSLNQLLAQVIGGSKIVKCALVFQLAWSSERSFVKALALLKSKGVVGEDLAARIEGRGGKIEPVLSELEKES